MVIVEKCHTRIPLVLDLVLDLVLKKTFFTFLGHIFFKDLCFENLRNVLDFRIGKVVKYIFV